MDFVRVNTIFLGLQLLLDTIKKTNEHEMWNSLSFQNQLRLSFMHQLAAFFPVSAPFFPVSAVSAPSFFTVSAPSFFPARIIEIWRPLLNAWLKSRRVWNSEANGNHDKMAIGMKSNKPIMYSYALASSFIESQNPIHINNDLHACPIYKGPEIGY